MKITDNNLRPFEEPAVEVLVFAVEDVITTSGDIGIYDWIPEDNLSDFS